MPAEGAFTFTSFLADVFVVFLFVALIWLLIMVIFDLFRRQDIPGWGKALWVIGLLLFPFIGVLAYMIVESKGMTERANQQAQQARDQLRSVVGFSVADEIKKLDELKKSGSLTNEEYTRLRGKLVQ